MKIPESLLGQTIYVYFSDGVRDIGTVTLTKNRYELKTARLKKRFSAKDVCRVKPNQITLSFPSNFATSRRGHGQSSTR